MPILFSIFLFSSLLFGARGHEEDHKMTRAGEPKHLVESLNWQLYWFSKHIDQNAGAKVPDALRLTEGGLALKEKSPLRSSRFAGLPLWTSTLSLSRCFGTLRMPARLRTIYWIC